MLIISVTFGLLEGERFTITIKRQCIEQIIKCGRPGAGVRGHAGDVLRSADTCVLLDVRLEGLRRPNGSLDPLR